MPIQNIIFQNFYHGITKSTLHNHNQLTQNSNFGQFVIDNTDIKQRVTTLDNIIIRADNIILKFRNDKVRVDIKYCNHGVSNSTTMTKQ